jgi:hypothetical protein
LFSCGSPNRAPNLVELRELGPRHVEVGDRLRLSGAGFPEGRPAKLLWRGEVLRAGEPPLQDVELSTPAQLVSPHALDVVVDAQLVEALCGSGPLRHTTFRGDVEVAFSPRTSQGSVVSGRLDGVVVDLTPDAVHPDALSALKKEGRRFAEFVGAELSPTEDGLSVARLEPRSRAERAGVEVGDVILELDGMVLRGSVDFVPPPNAKLSSLLVRRGAENLPLRIESAGFRYSSPQRLRPAIAILGAALTLFLVLFSPLGRALALFERRILERLREETSSIGFALHSPARRAAALGLLLRQLPESFLPYLALVFASALFTLLALGKSVVAAELDLVVIPAGTLAGFIMATFVARQSDGHWSLNGAVRRSFAMVALNVPLGAVLVVAALRVGGLRSDEMVAAQGPLPWQWQGFQSPLLAVCAGLAVLGLVPLAASVRSLGWQRRPTRGERLVRLAQWIHQLVCVGVLSVVAFGGFPLPSADSSLFVQVFGALLLLGKSWTLLLAVALVRSVLGNLDVMTLGIRPLLVLSGSALTCVGLAWMARSLAGSPLLETLGGELGPLLFGALVVAALSLCFRVSRGLRAPNVQVGIQPWL